MSEIVIYHNPRCGKSRAAKALLEERGVPFRVVEYLREPLDVSALRALARTVGVRASELVRTGEAEYAEHCAGRALDEEGWLAALAAHPILLQRPIVTRGDRGVIGRPPENVLALL